MRRVPGVRTMWESSACAVFRERDYPNIPRWSENRRYGRDDWSQTPRPAEEEYASRNVPASRAPAAPSTGAGIGG